MSHAIRQAQPEDAPLLWEMLYYAAHMNEDGETDIVRAARHNPDLVKYVEGWGKPGDLGVVAFSPNGQASGAAWLRPLEREKPFKSSYLDDINPELAVAVRPEYIGQGLGTQLLKTLLEIARPVYPTIILSVRDNNPARHLYERLGFKVVEQITNRVGTKSHLMQYQFHWYPEK